MNLMLAFGSTNYLQKNIKIQTFSDKNAKKPTKSTKFSHTKSLLTIVVFTLNEIRFQPASLMGSHSIGNPADKAGSFAEACFEERQGQRRQSRLILYLFPFNF